MTAQAPEWAAAAPSVESQYLGLGPGAWWLAVPVVFGLAIVLLAVRFDRRWRRARAEWPQAVGEVVRDESDGGSDWDCWVRFDADGQRVVGHPAGPQIRWVRRSRGGETVPVWYDPDYPRTFFAQVHEHDNEFWRFGAIGVVVAAIPLLLLAVATL